MIYICDECEYETVWSEEDFSDKGEPVCPNCDNDMARIDERFEYAQAVSDTLDILKVLRSRL